MASNINVAKLVKRKKSLKEHVKKLQQPKGGKRLPSTAVVEEEEEPETPDTDIEKKLYPTGEIPKRYVNVLIYPTNKTKTLSNVFDQLRYYGKYKELNKALSVNYDTAYKFIDYFLNSNNTDSNYVWNEYVKQIDTSDTISFIKSRKPKEVKATVNILRRPFIDTKVIKIPKNIKKGKLWKESLAAIGSRETTFIEPGHRGRIKGPELRIRKYEDAEILSKCIQYNKRASWVAKYVNYKPIKCTVLRKKEHPYLEPYATDEEIIGSDDKGTGWYKANRRWYEIGCNESSVEKIELFERHYESNSVGYLLRFYENPVKIIVETREIYDSWIQWFNKSKTVKEEAIDVRVPTLESYEIAKFLFLQNEYIVKSGIDVDELVSMLSTESNYMISKMVSKILVFLTKLINKPQIHISRLVNGQYTPRDLIEIDRCVMLPEVYKNPHADVSEVNKIIKSRRKVIEYNYYDRFRLRSGYERTSTTLKTRPIANKRYEIPSITLCPTTTSTNDLVYYRERDIMYCFDRNNIGLINPYTGTPFTDTFIEELNRLKAAKIVGNKEIGKLENLQGVDETKELAPGLFELLKADLDWLLTIYCAECNEEIRTSSYAKTINKGQKVSLCSDKCMDKYKIS